MKIVAAFIVFATFFASCKTDVKHLPFYNTSDFTPHFLNDVPDDYHHIRNFNVTAQTGKSVTEKAMNGKICVADFFFTTCPGICPRLTTNMKLLQDSFLTDDKVLLLSYSVTPDKDSVAVLKRYAGEHQVNDKRWLLLTGNKNEIYDLGRKYFFVEEDLGEKRDTSEFLHTENFVLVDGKRRIRGIYNGLNLSSVKNLVRDIKELEQE